MVTIAVLGDWIVIAELDREGTDRLTKNRSGPSARLSSLTSISTQTVPFSGMYTAWLNPEKSVYQEINSKF